MNKNKHISFITSQNIAATLIFFGIKNVIICPGSRNAPLIYAFADAEKHKLVKNHISIDERSAGFLALGLSKANNKTVPPVVITTSGTAIAELYPSILEAHYTDTPIIIISADRSQNLNIADNNQIISQVHMYKNITRLSVNFTSYITQKKTIFLSSLSLMASLGYQLTSLKLKNNKSMIINKKYLCTAGPTHINASFAEPLTPVSIHNSFYKYINWDILFKKISFSKCINQVDNLLFLNKNSLTNENNIKKNISYRKNNKTAVIAGDEAGIEAGNFAEKYNLPLFAEPSSNIRHKACSIHAYTTILSYMYNNDNEIVSLLNINKIVIFGRPTLSREIKKLIFKLGNNVCFYQPKLTTWFTFFIKNNKPIFCRTLQGLLSFSGKNLKNWLNVWKKIDNYIFRLINKKYIKPQSLNQFNILQSIWKLSDKKILVLGASSIIRSMNLLKLSQKKYPKKIFSNRGVSGIDGIISTASGISLFKKNNQVRLVIGDISFLYDVGSLFLGILEINFNLQIIVINDQCGSIFSTLEYGRLAKKQILYKNILNRFFLTPHNINIGLIANAYKIPYNNIASKDELIRILSIPIVNRSIIEINLKENKLKEFHEFILQSISKKCKTLI